MGIFHAHSANGAGRWHPLRDHLAEVSTLARAFAGAAPWRDEAGLAGCMHDLGKYGDRFQARLRGADSGLDHWSAGAWLALTWHKAVAAALAIQGHHVGLQAGNPVSLAGLDPDRIAHRHPLGLSLSEPDYARITTRASADGLDIVSPREHALPVGPQSWERAVAAMLDVRLLFSCLVDADFLDTEAHFDGDAAGKCPRQPGPVLDPHAALAALDGHMAERVRSGNRTDPRVLNARESLWQAVIEAAKADPGCFTLTAPTGSGKTLAMLKLALEHAARHGLRRIIVAVPFLTVIEQSARVYREVLADFPADYILEHHSLAGLGPEAAPADTEGTVGAAERRRRQLAENWDAPIVLTTNVQLLESLFSNRPSACRKLHRLMRSVILLDEAQSLPQDLAVPTLAALSHLAETYRSSVVFATATQPAFETLDTVVCKHAAAGWRPREAVPGHPSLFAELKRVVVHWPVPGEQYGWDELADRLHTIPQVLCVLNLKRHAREVLERMRGTDGLFHLSTNLCPSHRQAVLERVRERLRSGQECRLIATQCIEAGVDLDFPRVYRAFAPLEAVAQAAGRCNREGRGPRLGEVVVFEPEVEGDWRRRYPTHAYYQAAAVTYNLLAEFGDLDINRPQVFRDYYRRLYDLTCPASRNQALDEAIQARDFGEVARLYRLIDQDAVQVLVPWGGESETFEALRAEAERDGIDGNWMRRAQGLAVSLYRPRPDHPAWGLFIPARLNRHGVSDEWHILEDPDGTHYDPNLGLILPESDLVFIA